MSENTNHASLLESPVNEQPARENDNDPYINSDRLDIKQKSLESQSLSNSSKNIDWHKLAHKLREHNRKLLKRVFTLEQEIAEIQNRLQEQSEQSQTSDLLVAQQAEKLNEYQEEIARLEQELEVSQQEHQGQQILITTLSQQLELTQQQNAKLERECAELQQSNNDKSYKLLTTQQQIQELQNRLNRQQQNAIKYKSALEQYTAKVDLAKPLVASSGLTPLNSEPIKPWSETINESQKSAIVNEHLESSLTTSKIEGKPSNSTWPAPEIANVNADKQPKSIAAVQLPRFPRQASSS